MKIAVEELEACKRSLQVEAPEDLVQKAWAGAYERIQRQARLPGFRRGHVPRSLVKLHFAEEVRQEVARRLIPEVYRQALAETKIRPVEEPNFKDVTLEEGSSLKFTAVVEIKPTITLGTYTGLTLQRASASVTDEDVEETLCRLREQQAEFRVVERAAGAGDLVIIDYTLAPEGMEPKSERGYAFVVGSEGILPEINEAVIGLAAGGERDARVRFPESHQREDLRGKPGEARVRVVEVKEKVLPPLDDGLAKALGEHESLEALRAAIRKELEGRREREARRALEEKTVDALLAGHDFQVPEALVLRQVAYLIESARERIRQSGGDPDRISWDYGKLADELRPAADRTVRRALLLEAIAEREGLTPSDADLEAEVERIALASRRPAQAVRRLLEKGGELDGLRVSLREARTLDFLIEHAIVQTDVH